MCVNEDDSEAIGAANAISFHTCSSDATFGNFFLDAHIEFA